MAFGDVDINDAGINIGDRHRSINPIRIRYFNDGKKRVALLVWVSMRERMLSMGLLSCCLFH